MIEFMISMMIMSLLFSFCLPFYQKHVSQTKTILLKRELIAVLTTARLEAFVLNKTLKLEPLFLTASGVWQQGVRLQTAEGEILHRWVWPESSIEIRWFGFHSKQAIVIAAHPDKLAMNGYFQIDQTRLVVNRFGRVRI